MIQFLSRIKQYYLCNTLTFQNNLGKDWNMFLSLFYCCQGFCHYNHSCSNCPSLTRFRPQFDLKYFFKAVTLCSNVFCSIQPLCRVSTPHAIGHVWFDSMRVSMTRPLISRGLYASCNVKFGTSTTYVFVFLSPYCHMIIFLLPHDKYAFTAHVSHEPDRQRKAIQHNTHLISIFSIMDVLVD